MYIDLSEKEILVTGGGTIASRRIRTMCGFAGRITVTAPEIAAEIYELSEEYPITVLKRKFQPRDLEGKALVLAATNDEECNNSVFELCRKKGIPVNVCSDQTKCDFQFPSVVQHGDVVIGINASGRNHRLVKETRRKVERVMEISDSERKYCD